MPRHHRQHIGELQGNRTGNGTGTGAGTPRGRIVNGQRAMRVETGPQPLPDPDLGSFDPLAHLDRQQILEGLRDGTIVSREHAEEEAREAARDGSRTDDDLDDVMAGWVGKSDRTKYDPTKAYVRATNRQDHSTTVQFAIPREVMMWVDKIVAERSEYKSRADFCRDAIYHGIWRLVGMVERDEVDDPGGVLAGDGLRRALLLEMFRCEQAEQQAEVDGLVKVVEDADLLFDAIVQAGDPAHMDRAVEFHSVLAEQMPRVWREKIEDVVGRAERAWDKKWGG